jgi:hypothetical protein
MGKERVVFHTFLLEDAWNAMLASNSKPFASYKLE